MGKLTWIIVAIVVIVLIVAGFMFFGKGYNNTQTNNGNTGTPASAGSSSSANNIEIKNFAFSPSSLTIKVGDSVTWINSDSAPHTVTSDSGSELDSSTLANGASYSHTFNTAGTYNYHCSIHTSMKGTIIVQ